MKKFLMIFGVLLFTGCSNELVCTMNTAEENYELEQKITFQFDEEKVVSAETNYIMVFENKETASSYMSVFDTLEDDYEINQSGNKINIISTKNYEQYNQNKDKLKEELENNGYSCKY